MYGNTGHSHPKTKAERDTMMRLEARSHATECERQAAALRLLFPQSPAAAVLENAAKFIRYFAGTEDA
jgi:hypothetical protein